MTLCTFSHFSISCVSFVDGTEIPAPAPREMIELESTLSNIENNLKEVTTNFVALRSVSSVHSYFGYGLQQDIRLSNIRAIYTMAIYKMATHKMALVRKWPVRKWPFTKWPWS